MATMLAIPLPPLLHRRRRPFSPSDSHLAVLRPPLRRTATPCASTAQSTPYPSVAEDVSPPLSPPVDELSVEAQTVASRVEDPQFRGCKTCGKEETERGCNGEGRIQGGIATVPGFGWWPIKAYRPCPGFVASGGRYRRKGQSMDEVASGRAKRGTSSESSTKAKSSKRKK